MSDDDIAAGALDTGSLGSGIATLDPAGVTTLAGACDSLVGPSIDPLSAMDEIDRRIGELIRQRRIMLGLSQQQLARAVGVTAQQEHKYERSLSRITAGRLWLFARALGVSPAWFFESAMPAPEGQGRNRLCLEMSRVYATIANDSHQEALLRMARALTAATPASSGAGAD